MNETYSHDNNVKDDSQVAEKSTIIAQILGYSPPDIPRSPILSEFDPPLAEDQIAVFRKIANALAKAAIQTTDQGEQKQVGFPERKEAAETDHE